MLSIVSNLILVLQEIKYYTPLAVIIENTTFPLLLVLLYSVLCIYVVKMKGFSNVKVDKAQLQVKTGVRKEGDYVAPVPRHA